MKPFQLILIAVFSLGALAGLYFFGTYSAKDSQDLSIGKVEIWGTLPEEGVLQLLRSLGDRDENYINVTYVEIDERSFSVTLADAIAGERGPDLILISQELLLQNRERLTFIPNASISERTFRDTYLPIAELWRTQEGMYGIPFVLDPLMMYYNRTHLANKSIARAPSTWESVLALAPTLTTIDTDQRITKAGIALGEYENVYNARAIVSLLMLQGGSQISEYNESGVPQAALMNDLKNPALGSGPAVSALSFYTQFANPAKTVFSWSSSLKPSREAFIAQNLTLYLGFASELPYLLASGPNVDFDIARVPQPGTSDARMTYGKLYALAVMRTSDNADSAFLTADAISRSFTPEEITTHLSMISARKDHLKVPENDPFAPVIYGEALVARGWLSPTPSQTDTIFSTMISNIQSGRKTVIDALMTAEQALNQVLR